MVRTILQKHIHSALDKLGFPDQDIALDHPTIAEHGDYSTSVALKLPQKRTVLEKENPKEIAKKIVEMLQKDRELNTYISRIEVAGPGFINFWISKEHLLSSLRIVSEKGTRFGKLSIGKNKTVMVEFGQPNTHKLPHIGHFRSYSLGESLSRILECAGYKIIRANYQGDVGLHVAKCLWGWKDLKLEESDVLTENIQSLQKAYEHGSKKYDEKKEEIDLINKKIYEKDEELLPFWEKTREWSLSYYDKLNSRLGTSYDKGYLESMTAEAGKKVVAEHIGRVFEKSEGAIVFAGEKYGLHTRVFITKNGNPTYEAKDLGLIFLKSNDFMFDSSLIATANEQVEYFKVVYQAAALIAPELADKFRHIPFGMVTLKGSKLSSRTGNIVSIEQLLDAVSNSLTVVMRAKEYNQDDIDTNLDTLTIAAAKYSILKNDPGKNIVFDIAETVSIEGNSGPYLLYTYARCRSVITKSKEQSDEGNNSRSDQGTMLPEEISLLRTLYRFPEMVEAAAKFYSPHIIATFLYDTAQKYNLFYQKAPILKAEKKDKDFRLALTDATSQILKNGLNLLGISVLERM